MMKKIVKIFVLFCGLLMITNVYCAAADLGLEYSSAEVDRRLSNVKPEDLYSAICNLGSINRYYKVSKLYEKETTDTNIDKLYYFYIGEDSLIMLKKYKPRGLVQGGWKGESVIEAWLSEADMNNDKHKNPGFRLTIQVACYIGLIYYLEGEEKYNKNLNANVYDLLYMLNTMNSADNLIHGYNVKVRGPLIYDDKGNVIATLSPNTQWQQPIKGKRCQYFAIGVYPFQIIS